MHPIAPAAIMVCGRTPTRVLETKVLIMDVSWLIRERILPFNALEWDFSDHGDYRTNYVKYATIYINDVDLLYYFIDIQDYDRIEVVAIYYGTISSTPTINIVEVSGISDTMYIVDEGDWNQGQYSLEEFTLINNPMSPKKISAEKNILFLSSNSSASLSNNSTVAQSPKLAPQANL